MPRLLILILCCLFLLTAAEEKVEWKPNKDAEPSLPMSMRQRQQLKQLEEALLSSPDPEGTLKKVAEANGMSPQDLVSMIEKNSRDLAQNPSLAQPTTIPRAIWKVFGSVFVMISQSAKRHPRSFTMTMMTICFLLYASITIPRTGMHISNGRSLLSKGPTTLFLPPQKYLQKLADDSSFDTNTLSIQTKKEKWDDLAINEEGVKVHSLSRKSPLAFAISSRILLKPDSFMDEHNTDEEDEEEESNTSQQDEILEVLFESAADLMSSKRFAEFSTDDNSMRVAASSDRQKYGILLVPGLGSLGRYGLIYWQATQTLESGKDLRLTLTTLKGKSLFDGQIHFHVQRFKSNIAVSVHLVVPKGGRKIRKALATNVVSGLIEGLEVGVSQRTKQTLARTSQGRRFKSGSHRRAMERRNSRFEREKQLEEMSEDRRRKWQRQNPDAGRYRPSGHRLRSPNNC